ncbi:heat shock protein Hsp70, partial [Russula emetica]
VITEPTAVALAYGLDRAENSGSVIAVYDLGGGTFNSDINLPFISSGPSNPQHININQKLLRSRLPLLMVSIVWRTPSLRSTILVAGPSIPTYPRATETARMELSSTSQTEINLPFISSGLSNPQHINQKLLHSQLPLLMVSIVQRTLSSRSTILVKAGVKASNINEVILVGGMMCMPRVVETVKTVFGCEPSKTPRV